MSDVTDDLLGSDVVAIFLRVARKDIAYIKFIIESYEGIGVVRTLNPRLAVIVVLATPDLAPTVRQVIASLRRGALVQISYLAIVPPADRVGSHFVLSDGRPGRESEP